MYKILPYSGYVNNLSLFYRVLSIVLISLSLSFLLSFYSFYLAPIFLDKPVTVIPDVRVFLLVINFFLIFLLWTILFHLYHYHLNIIKVFTKQMELDVEMVKSESELLELQINPHFIFNVLNSIKSLIITSKSNAIKAISLLETCLFEGYSKRGFGLISLETELEIVKSYSQIEIIRYGKSLSFVFDIEDNLNEVMMPAGMLLVLVENAVKHGKRINGKANNIVISIKTESNNILIVVENSGQLSTNSFGIVQEPQKSGIGLINLTKRLTMYFPEKHHVSWCNKNADRIAVIIKLKIK